MNALDSKARKLALSMLTKFGKTVTLTSSATDPTYVPSTGTVTPGTATVQSVKALVESYGAGIVFMSNGTIKATDRKATIAAQGLTVSPKPGHTVTVDSVVHSVVAVKEIWSGDQVAVYELQVRA